MVITAGACAAHPFSQNLHGGARGVEITITMPHQTKRRSRTTTPFSFSTMRTRRPNPSYSNSLRWAMDVGAGSLLRPRGDLPFGVVGVVKLGQDRRRR